MRAVGADRTGIRAPALRVCGAGGPTASRPRSHRHLYRAHGAAISLVHRAPNALGCAGPHCALRAWLWSSSPSLPIWKRCSGAPPPLTPAAPGARVGSCARAGSTSPCTATSTPGRSWRRRASSRATRASSSSPTRRSSARTRTSSGPPPPHASFATACAPRPTWPSPGCRARATARHPGTRGRARCSPRRRRKPHHSARHARMLWLRLTLPHLTSIPTHLRTLQPRIYARPLLVRA